MPIQAPQWTDYLNCPACCREFAPSRSPISLGCGHTLCRVCLKNLHRRQCPFDQTLISVDLEELVVNTALLQLAGYTPPSQPYHPPCIQVLSEQDRHAYDVIVKCLEQLAVFLKFCGNANMMGSRLSRPMQRKLVTLLQCAITDEEGRGKAARAARSLGDRTVTELIVHHQNPQQLSANLWAAVRSRGCQFLGPAMQEEVLKLVLLALEDGSALSRKVLVMFVVQRLEPHFPQASKTSIGHVVQLLYRASCFKVSKRVCDSSLMQLKEEFRTYDSLRREHDAQIVQIATEAGLRIAPDQWSALLYGDTQHKSHMQSIIDKLQTPQSFAQSVQELFITLQRTGDPAQLIAMSIPLDCLANIDASPDAKSPTWQQLCTIITALKEVVSRLVHFLQHQSTGRDNNHSVKVIDRLPEPPSQQSSVQGLPGRYKVAMCRDAQARTYCPRGNNCTYAHSEEELERYRRINLAVGNYPFLMQPVIAVSHPIYQRFTVPPPPLSNMEHNYNMPPMQQQGSPSSRGSMVGVDAMEREQSYEPSYESSYEPSYESSYEHDREKSYDHRESSYDHREPMYNHRELSSYDQREPTYDIREPSYDYRDLTYDNREQSYERPPPNNSADNYTASYANVLMHGGANMARRGQGSQHERQHQNGNRNNVMASHGGYYPRYSDHAGYSHMQRYDTGRVNSEEMSMYPARSGRVASDATHDYPVEYKQMNYAEENVPEMHYEPRPYRVSMARQMPMAQQPQEPTWQPKTMKSPPMFKINERAKNVPPGMEIGKSMPIGIDLGRHVPIGMEKGKMEMGKNMPISMETGKNVPIFSEMGKNVPIGAELGKNVPIGAEMGQNVPFVAEMGQNMPIVMEMGNQMPIGSEMGNNYPNGMDMMPIGTAQTNGEMRHHGGENVRMQAKVVVRTETEKRDYQELEKELKALEQRISTEFSKASDQFDTDVED